MAGAPPIFGAVEKLVGDISKAQVQAQVAQQMFQIRIAAERERQRTEAAALKVKAESEQANAQASAQEPLDIASLFPEVPLGQLRAQGGPSPVSVSDAVGSFGGPAGAAAGGAAVQAFLKGGGGPPQATGPGGVPVPNTLTSRRTVEDYQPIDTGRYGTVLRPTTRTETVEEPNALTPAQAIQLRLEELRGNRQASEADRQFEQTERFRSAELALQSREADAVERRLQIEESRGRRTEEREERSERIRLGLDIARTVPGIDAARSVKAVDAALSGDVAKAFEIIGPDVTKANEFEEKIRARQIEKFDAELENLRADTALKGGRAADIAQRTIAELSGLPVPARGQALTGNQLLTRTSQLFDAQGAFKPGEMANLRALQGEYLTKDKLLVVTDTGGLFSSEQTELLDTAELARWVGEFSAQGPGAREALASLVSYRTPAGRPLFTLTEEGLGPAVSKSNPSYGGIDAFLVGARNAALQERAVAPTQQPSELETLSGELERKRQALAGLVEKFPPPLSTTPGDVPAPTPDERQARSAIDKLRDEVRALQAKIAGRSRTLVAEETAAARKRALTDAQAELLNRITDQQLEQMRKQAGSR